MLGCNTDDDDGMEEEKEEDQAWRGGDILCIFPPSPKPFQPHSLSS